MTIKILQTSRTKTDNNPTDRFEKWIQAPLTQYRSAYVGNELQLFLVQPVTSTSASQVSPPAYLSALSQSIAAEADDSRLLSGWLAVAEDAFNFWNNDLDADYDNL